MATEIVKRIDDLGRIVIPKELRKNLNIRLGELMEISIDSSNNLILKKRRSLKLMEHYINELLNIFKLSSNHNFILVDNDDVIAATDKTNLNFSELSTFCNNKIKEEKMILCCGKYYYYLLEPIIVDSNYLGSVIVLSNNNDFKEIDSTFIKLLQLFIRIYIEE
jgi:AbrB family transcriptional regulator (stage V sporulation protein T)